MADITAKQVKQLRDATNVSMMECKNALVEADGDIQAATRILRERGMAVAAKKASRTANQGLIASATADDGAVSLIEVNCETDFVARNPDFQSFTADLAARASLSADDLAETAREEITAKVAEIGENIIVRRATRFAPEGPGILKAYIHQGGKVGVIVDLACTDDASASAPALDELARDLTLQVAAAAPRFLNTDDVDEDVAAEERGIYASQVQDKPAQIVEKIVDGKMRKFFQEICLVEQAFVKEPKQTIRQLLEEKGKELGDTLTIRRFVRYQLGE